MYILFTGYFIFASQSYYTLAILDIWELLVAASCLYVLSWCLLASTRLSWSFYVIAICAIFNLRNWSLRMLFYFTLSGLENILRPNVHEMYFLLLYASILAISYAFMWICLYKFLCVTCVISTKAHVVKNTFKIQICLTI